MEYDLIRLFDHEKLCLFEYIAAAIVTFDPDGINQCVIHVTWRRSAGEVESETNLTLKWNLDAIRARHPMIDRQLQSFREWDEDQSERTEHAAIVVAVAVMESLEPGSRFTFRLAPGKRHDYCLNETQDEMIEIAGRWKDGLQDLFDTKRAQSDLYPNLRKRWVSVTIARETPRNRTEGLHS
jgi:hypothetical protein